MYLPGDNGGDYSDSHVLGHSKSKLEEEYPEKEKLSTATTF